MREGMPQNAGVRREEVMAALQKDGNSPAAKRLLKTWYDQEIDKQLSAPTPGEQYRIRFETAAALSELGLLNRARGALEQIASDAAEEDEGEFQEEAEKALAALPQVH